MKLAGFGYFGLIDSMATNFAGWAFDARRSREERFGAQILVEHAMPLWRAKHKIPVEPINYEAARLYRNERKLNPAYEPVFSREDAERVEEVLGELKALNTGHGEDRSLRDLSILQFCPALEKARLFRTEIRDWTPLGECSQLRDVLIMDDVARDFRPLARLTQLNKLWMWLWAPWPDLTGFEGLTELREFHYSGNVLALGSIPRLPAVRDAKFDQRFNFHVPVRSIAELPEMPELRRFYLENTWKLDGIERSPLLLNLEVFGHFDDLTPLSVLQHLTHLTVSGGYYESVEPLARLPALRHVLVRRDNPQDYSALAEAPRLHEIQLEICTINKVEVGALNAVLAPWSDEFGVHSPRPLQPLQLVLRDDDYEKEVGPAAARDWGEDTGMAESEDRWFKREINRRLNKLLGKGWGHISTSFCSGPGNEHVTISRGEDIDRFPQIVECLRRLIATAKYPWTLTLIVDSLAEFERDLEDIEGADEDETEKEFDAETERANWEYSQEKQREHREFLEREYRFRLQQQQGLPVNPQEFAPPPEAKEEEDDIASRGAKYDTGVRLRLYSTLTEASFVIHETDLPLAKMLLEIKD
jgi:hypothetical protein